MDGTVRKEGQKQGFPARGCTGISNKTMCYLTLVFPAIPYDKVVTEEVHLTFLASFGEHFEHLIREKNTVQFSQIKRILGM